MRVYQHLSSRFSWMDQTVLKANAPFRQHHSIRMDQTVLEANAPFRQHHSVLVLVSLSVRNTMVKPTPVLKIFLDGSNRT
jgi:hypothetical protein